MASDPQILASAIIETKWSAAKQGYFSTAKFAFQEVNPDPTKTLWTFEESWGLGRDVLKDNLAKEGAKSFTRSGAQRFWIAVRKAANNALKAFKTPNARTLGRVCLKGIIKGVGFQALLGLAMLAGAWLPPLFFPNIVSAQESEGDVWDRALAFAVDHQQVVNNLRTCRACLTDDKFGVMPSQILVNALKQMKEADAALSEWKRFAEFYAGSGDYSNSSILNWLYLNCSLWTGGRKEAGQSMTYGDNPLNATVSDICVN
jgi:hypothetical protein